MPAKTKAITQPRGGTKKPQPVNNTGKLLVRIPPNIKKLYFDKNPGGYKLLQTVWQDLKNRNTNYEIVLQLAIDFALEQTGYHYAKKMAALKRVIENERGQLMVSPWVKIERMHLRELQSLAKALGLDPYTRAAMPAPAEIVIIKDGQFDL